MLQFDAKLGSEVVAEQMIALGAELPLVAIESDIRFFYAAAFAQQYPERFIDCGIAESNTVGVAAGIAEAGMIPVIHSLAPFITRRVYDQLVVSIAYSGLNCKVLGDSPGLYAEINGGTHMCVEDVAIMRAIPRFIVADACDNEALRALLPQVMRHPDPVYLRVARKTYPVYERGATFTLGKANLLRDGGDAAIIANSLMVPFALEAARVLALEGIDVMVYDMHTIKPIDKEAILHAAQTGRIVTAENNSVLGGLGSAVAEVLAEQGGGVRMARIGIQDQFGVTGYLDYLTEKFGMRPEDIAQAVRGILAQ
nr:transketolase C-terminal domain-containing protein [Maliibacterium massiliense]